MKKRIIKIIVYLTAAVMMLWLVGCSHKKTDASGFTVDKVVMTYVSSPLNVPSIIEKEQGQFGEAFQKLGLGFAYSNLTAGSDQTAALASGDIQILNAVGGSSVILAAANGADIVILSMYSRAPKAFCMFSNDENINSPEDLRRLTIAGPKGTNLHELLAAYLATADLTIDDVNYVSMDIPSAVAALESGSVDVALAGGPAAYNCEKSGKHKITDGEGLIAATVCTAASRKFADENPEIIKTFLDTQKSLVEYMSTETEEALEITAKALDFDKEAVREMFRLYDFSAEITEEDILRLQDTENFLYDCGMTENHIDVSKLIYKKEKNHELEYNTFLGKNTYQFLWMPQCR